MLDPTEDRHFRDHWGVRPGSLVRARQQNRKAGRIVSGGSTITMQVSRMARGDRDRTWWNKFVEVLDRVADRTALRQGGDPDAVCGQRAVRRERGRLGCRSMALVRS
ncbi:MAG: transglycosylase domain-containing protein [Flavobacteriales bacterium]|nr:transglycosylase domain-containing protein [Flavobacteriales bacterium]